MTFDEALEEIASRSEEKRKVIEAAKQISDRIAHEYVNKDAAMMAACRAFCHPGALCPDGYCREVREAFDILPIKLI